MSGKVELKSQVLDLNESRDECKCVNGHRRVGASLEIGRKERLRLT